ncbi:DUF1552 domain-containing protein [Rubritalea spongiae]|uniref:DUF1552 domain-containing protein n=1 Tax=Rubritalea spongiae TaxID=430797 RepID=A0ABW5E2H5_9BACT
MNPIATNLKTRRSILKMGSSILALPFLETFAMAKGTSASVASAAPKRLVFLGGGYGFTHQSFYPKEAGRFADIGLTQGLKPLERHINDITMVDKLFNPNITDPHAGTAGYLAGAKNKVSCDQVAAQYFSGQARYQSLVLTAMGDNGTSGHGKGGLTLSCSTQGKPMDGIKRPIDFYYTLFGDGEKSPKEVEKMLAQKRSVLDVIASNGTTMKRRLAKHDQERLEEYFQSVRDIELGLERQAKWAHVPKPEAPFDEPSQDLTGVEEVKIMLDMIILALQTDSTRVATYRFPVESLLKSIEVSISGHVMSHYSSSVTKRQDSEKRDKAVMELFAHFIDRLKATEDRNGGTLYDSTIVNYGSNLRTGHTLRGCPTILSGGGVTNIKHGSHIVLPELTPTSNYWLTLLQEAGVEVNQFNESSGVVSQMLS